MFHVKRSKLSVLYLKNDAYYVPINYSQAQKAIQSQLFCKIYTNSIYSWPFSEKSFYLPLHAVFTRGFGKLWQYFPAQAIYTVFLQFLHIFRVIFAKL